MSTTSRDIFFSNAIALTLTLIGVGIIGQLIRYIS